MSTKTEAESPAFDTVKLAFAALLLVGGVVAFYFFQNDVQLIVRVVGLIVAVMVALGISLQTVKGREVSSFVREAQIEVRKVVWPTKQETVQTTLIVMVSELGGHTPLVIVQISSLVPTPSPTTIVFS